MDLEKKNVLVTGGNGFLGSNVVNEIKKKGVANIVIPSSKDCDLRIQENCKNIVKDIDIVFHLGDVGKEPMINVFGNNPQDVVKKTLSIINHI